VRWAYYAALLIAPDWRLDQKVIQGGLSYVNRQIIVDFAAEHRLPAIYHATVFARAGGLMTWAPNLIDQLRIPSCVPSLLSASRMSKPAAGGISACLAAAGLTAAATTSNW